MRRTRLLWALAALGLSLLLSLAVSSADEEGTAAPAARTRKNAAPAERDPAGGPRETPRPAAWRAPGEEALPGGPTSVPTRLSRGQLIRRSLTNLNLRRQDAGELPIAIPDDPAGPEFWKLQRIAVAFLRHRAPYEELLDFLRDKLPRGEAYEEVKTRVLLAIAAEYPWLAEECRIQIAQCRRGRALAPESPATPSR